MAELTAGTSAALAAGLMRRQTTTGEVCAQALYAAQALVARDFAVRSSGSSRARPPARERGRNILAVDRSNASPSSPIRPSLLNPLLVNGALRFAHRHRGGKVARRSAANLGFRARNGTTGRGAPQRGTCERLPASDLEEPARSSEQMRDDLRPRHAAAARAAGASPASASCQGALMRVARRTFMALCRPIGCDATPGPPCGRGAARPFHGFEPGANPRYDRARPSAASRRKRLQARGAYRPAAMASSASDSHRRAILLRHAGAPMGAGVDNAFNQP